MSAKHLPSYWEQAELKVSSNDAKDFLSVYSECSTTHMVPRPLGQPPRMTLHSIKSAIWSFMKAFTRDRYFNAIMKDQRMNSSSLG
ncbi:hypothetical protein MKX08_005863 [Trichoderma sp. CBMAI-0020]|nr:hypothetical protein MKX08_005863 [Trichoderma sp. CBMAI-0020]